MFRQLSFSTSYSAVCMFVCVCVCVHAFSKGVEINKANSTHLFQVHDKIVQVILVLAEEAECNGGVQASYVHAAKVGGVVGGVWNGPLLLCWDRGLRGVGVQEQQSIICWEEKGGVVRLDWYNGGRVIHHCSSQ